MKKKRNHRRLRDGGDGDDDALKNSVNDVVTAEFGYCKTTLASVRYVATYHKCW